METKALKKQLGAAIAMVLVAAIALGAATFAWFVNNNAVTATGVDVSTSSSVPNLYITSAGKTTDGMTPNDKKNPATLLPVSTSDGIHFYDTKHWTSAKEGGTNAFADEYKVATGTDDKNVYAEYTFKLGVTNGSMDVYFDSSAAATTLKAAPNMGTAGRFAISFSNVKVDNGDPKWMLFKVEKDPKSTATNYYTDKAAEDATQGDYWVTGAGNKNMVSAATYLSFGEYSGSINDKGQAVKGANKLTTIENGKEVTVTVRVWYEGCDPACVSENAGTQGIANAITGNLGFVGVQPASGPGVGA